MKKFLIPILAAIVIGGIIIFFLAPKPTNTPEPSTPSIPTGPISVRGTLVCLPHKDTTGPQTLECAFGLLDETGHYYALRNSDMNIAFNTLVVVEGTFTPQTRDKYQDIGIIDVDKIMTIN